MNPDKNKSLEAMRTYARDLERERGVSDNAGNTTSEEKAKQEAPKPEARPKKEKEKKQEKKKPKKENIKVVDNKTPEPKHIPAFHELQKAVKTDIDARAKKEEAPKLKPVKGIEPTKHVAGGTVITDNKKTRKPFFANLSGSLKKWFENLKKSFKPKKKNTYEVTQTNRRKGVVQKATSKTGTIFSADNETLKEQIKARQRAEKRGQDDEDLNWSPYTEPGYPLLEGEELESTDPRVVKVSVTPKTHAAPKPVIKSTDKIPELHEEKEEATLEAMVEETGGVIPDEPEPTPEPPAAPVEEDTMLEPDGLEFEPEEVIEPETEDEETEPTKTIFERWDEFSLKDTNTLAMLLVGIVLAVVIFGFVILRIFNLDENRNTPVATAPETAIYAGASLDEITVANRSFNEILVKTNGTLVEQNDSLAEYQYVQGNGDPLSSDVVMHLIQTEPSDGFANTVTKVRLVENSDQYRALILTTPDKTVSRGGMLNWEATLYADLGKLLGATNVPPNAGEFADMKHGSLDVRALMLNGSPLLVYALINESDVIITSNPEMLNPYTQD